ncbi:protein spaetzle-like isoform X2 [Contarinia nasturtii]|uniref:protein spaetzle-like isoform X2 n=1 Tax=Contarinia nasturtii TaxID=265458 RepID=UPI0012D43321|nr:protein spaetzle-like isoform X2 [Contarinia nasturtii]
MSVIRLQLCHCVLNLLMLSVIVSVVELTPLCGQIDGSSQPDSDKIYFKDRSQRIRTIAINGKVYACYPDGTMVDTTSSGENSNERLSEHEIRERIREDETNSTMNHHGTYMANVSRCADSNLSYCTNDTSYPMDIIEKLLRKQLHKYADAFGSDMISTNISTRYGGADEITLCDYYEEVIYPKSGRNQKGVDMFIINTNDHKQGVRVSKCVNNGQTCRMSENFPNGYRTECKQHFVYRELLTLAPDQTITRDKFEFPACCSCAVYRDDNF